MSLNPVKKFKNKQILSRLKNKDRQAFIKVYDENVEEIHRFVYFKISNHEEANDLTSMIFLKTWHYIQNKSLIEAKTLRALLYKIARTSIVDYYRETGSKLTLSIDDEDNPIEIVNDKEDLDEKVDKKNDLALIKRLLPRLKEEYREVLVMRFINDLSISEIADISGKTKGGVRVSIHRALNTLRDLVKQEEEL